MRKVTNMVKTEIVLHPSHSNARCVGASFRMPWGREVVRTWRCLYPLLFSIVGRFFAAAHVGMWLVHAWHADCDGDSMGHGWDSTRLTLFDDGALEGLQQAAEILFASSPFETFTRKKLQRWRQSLSITEQSGLRQLRH